VSDSAPGEFSGHGPKFSDSAGVPWAGRHFESNPFARDDGSAPRALHESLIRFARGSVGYAEVIAQIGGARFLIPLLAERSETGIAADGRVFDKAAELSVVSVQTPDGQAALPAFTSVATMTAWDASARPVPVTGVRLALAAVSEKIGRLIIDPGADTEFAVRAPAIHAVAAEQPWSAPWEDERVQAAFLEPASEFAVITGMLLTPGDPRARLVAPELTVTLIVMQGLDAGQLKDVTAELTQRWSSDPVIAARVDSIAVKLRPDPDAHI